MLKNREAEARKPKKRKLKDGDKKMKTEMRQKKVFT